LSADQESADAERRNDLVVMRCDDEPQSRARARENTIMKVDLTEVHRCLAALIAAIGARELPLLNF
jgi:hypothetical protein